MDSPDYVDLWNWHALSQALALTASITHARHSYQEVDELLQQLGSLPLFAATPNAPADSLAKGRYVERHIKKTLTALNRRVRRPIPEDNFGGQAIACWHLHVTTGTAVKRVGSAIATELDSPWASPKETVRARMWTTHTLERKRRSLGSWQGLLKILTELDRGLTLSFPPLPLGSRDDDQEDAAGLDNPPGNRTLDAIAEIRTGRRIQRMFHPQVWVDDYAFANWDMRVDVDRLGNSVWTADTVLTNISAQPREDIELPVWYSGAGRPIARVSFQRQRTVQHVPADPWDPTAGNGFFIVPFPRPLAPNDSLRLRYAYLLPDSFRDGDEWFEWYFARKHGRFTVTVSLDATWFITGLQASVPEEGRPPPAPKVSNNSVTWKVPFPERSKRYRLDWKQHAI